MLSADTHNRLKYALARGSAADEINALLGVSASGTAWFVKTSGNNGRLGTSWEEAYATITKAESVASAGDVIYVAAGEYDEDVTVNVAQLAIVGVGPRHSVRITGIATGSGGTATAMTIDGVDDVSLVNLNLEGRTGGGGLVINDTARRITVVGCRIHAGTSAAAINSSTGSCGWVTFDDCQFASATNGLLVTNSGGGISQQVIIRNSLFWSITTDCIKQSGFSQNWVIDGNTFGSDAGTEPTRFLDIDDASTTGFVCDNVFHTTVFSTAKFAIATGVLFANNISQAENPSAAVGGTAGRPD